LVIVTGGRGAGKTTWCLELNRRAAEAGLAPHGLISPPVFAGGEKLGIDLLRLPDGERRRLAGRIGNGSLPPPRGPATPDWGFDASTLEWADRFLGELPGGDLLILDELGPLELKRQTGLTAGLGLIDSRRYRLSCVVIRPELLSLAQVRWPWGEPLEIQPPLPPKESEDDRG
jgi:nucleoside-triphosphatase